MSAHYLNRTSPPIQIVFVMGIKVKRKSEWAIGKSNSICIEGLWIENRPLDGRFVPYSSYPIEAFLEMEFEPLTKHHYAAKSMHR
jgi:hypothetical protein